MKALGVLNALAGLYWFYLLIAFAFFAVELSYSQIICSLLLAIGLFIRNTADMMRQ